MILRANKLNKVEIVTFEKSRVEVFEVKEFLCFCYEVSEMWKIENIPHLQEETFITLKEGLMNSILIYMNMDNMILSDHGRVLAVQN